MAYVPQDRLQQFCRYYRDNSTVRSKIAFTYGVILPLGVIARARAKTKGARAIHGSQKEPKVSANGTDKPYKFQADVRQAVADLAAAIEREHPGHYR